jgi:hypothetical protein
MSDDSSATTPGPGVSAGTDPAPTDAQSRLASRRSQQATAIYQDIASNMPAMALYVLSGNASVEVSSSDVGITAPLSRAEKLAADIAAARDVLASLRRG